MAELPVRGLCSIEEVREKMGCCACWFKCGTGEEWCVCLQLGGEARHRLGEGGGERQGQSIGGQWRTVRRAWSQGRGIKATGRRLLQARSGVKWHGETKRCVGGEVLMPAIGGVARRC